MSRVMAEKLIKEAEDTSTPSTGDRAITLAISAVAQALLAIEEKLGHIERKLG